MNLTAYNEFGDLNPEFVNSLLQSLMGQPSDGVLTEDQQYDPSSYVAPPVATPAPAAPTPAPESGNYIRNNMTGATFDFGAPNQLQTSMQLAQAPMPDYAQPIEIAGVGKGYRDKNDSGRVILGDGRTALINVDRKATADRQRERVSAEKALLENDMLRANILKAQRAPLGPKPPAGQRFTADGTLEWIPGSPGDIKAKGAQQKAGDQLAVHDAGTDALIRNIDQLIGNPDTGSAEHKGLRGSIGYLDAKLPPINRDQATAQALIKGLLSKSAVSGLQQIRQSGTAPGSITEKEWPLFQNLIATLDPTQDEATFTEQLKELRRVAIESKARARAGYEGVYGAPSQAQPSVPSPSAPTASQYVEIRTTANGQKIGKKADGSYELVK